jgi:adenylate kinase family enzyme
MTQRILIMGLPGAGKTMLAGALKTYYCRNRMCVATDI